MGDTPVAAAMKQIGEKFDSDTGTEIKFIFGLSPAIQKRISEGEAVDVVVIQPTFLKELISMGKVGPGDYPNVARVGIGLFTRAGASIPDVSNVLAFKQALLDADTLVFSNVAAGNYFATVIDRLGITDAVKEKVVRTNPSDVVSRIVTGNGKDIGVISMTFIVSDNRLKLIGALPAEYQNYLSYLAAPMLRSQSSDAALSFVQFLASPDAKREFVATGAE